MLHVVREFTAGLGILQDRDGLFKLRAAALGNSLEAFIARKRFEGWVEPQIIVGDVTRRIPIRQNLKRGLEPSDSHEPRCQAEDRIEENIRSVARTFD